MKKAKRIKPVASTVQKTKTVKFQRMAGGVWEHGVAYIEAGRVLAISTKSETMLCPPYKVK